jgi:hypothetical protein
MTGLTERRFLIEKHGSIQFQIIRKWTLFYMYTSYNFVINDAIHDIASSFPASLNTSLRRDLNLARCWLHIWRRRTSFPEHPPHNISPYELEDRHRANNQAERSPHRSEQMVSVLGASSIQRLYLIVMPLLL